MGWSLFDMGIAPTSDHVLAAMELMKEEAEAYAKLRGEEPSQEM